MLALKEMTLPPAASDQAVKSLTKFVASMLKTEAAGLEEGLVELVSINLLFGDQNLLQTGVAKKDKLAGKRGSAMGPGMNTGQNNQDEELEPKIDLPVYRLNLVRRRVQAVATTAKEVLEELAVAATDKTKANDAIAELSDLISGANVGLKDLAAEDEDKKDDKDLLNDDEPKGPPKAIADKMKEMFLAAASNLESAVADKPAVGGEGQPASVEEALLNGN